MLRLNPIYAPLMLCIYPIDSPLMLSIYPIDVPLMLSIYPIDAPLMLSIYPIDAPLMLSIYPIDAPLMLSIYPIDAPLMLSIYTPLMLHQTATTIRLCISEKRTVLIGKTTASAFISKSQLPSTCVTHTPHISNAIYHMFRSRL